MLAILSPDIEIVRYQSAAEAPESADLIHAFAAFCCYDRRITSPMKVESPIALPMRYSALHFGLTLVLVGLAPGAAKSVERDHSAKMARSLGLFNSEVRLLLRRN